MSDTRPAPRPLLGGIQARYRALLAVLAAVVALLGLAAPTASAGTATGAQNAVATINPEPGPAVEGRGPVSPAVVGVPGPLFDDGAVVSLVAPRALPGGGDHVVLGKSIGLEDRAAKIGGRHLMGSADWQADVVAAISNPNTRISVALDGLEGAGGASSRVMAAVQRASSGRGSPLDWELMQLYQSGRLSTTTFYEGGRALTNPFG